jgi:hypothetical protein
VIILPRFSYSYHPGAVYSWGLGECGELGRIVPPLKHKVQVSVTYHGFAVVTVGYIQVGDDLEYDAEGIHNYHLQPGSMIHADTQSIVCDAKTIGCGAYHSLLVIGMLMMPLNIKCLSQNVCSWHR